MQSATFEQESSASDHSVRFYDADDELLQEVTEFLDGALRADGVAVAIATTPHRTELTRRLNGFGSKGRHGAAGNGKLVLLDADQMLQQFMTEQRPDPLRFEAAIGPLVRHGPAGKPLHAFGEMVALLCQRGNYDGALQVENLWNELLNRHRFSLFCAYPWKLFTSNEHAAAFRHVCETHRRVRDGAGRDASQSVTELQRQVRALEAELEQRKASERTLRRREGELMEFLDNAVEGIHKVAADGTILYANRAELRLLGYQWDEYVGRNIADFYVDQAHVREILTRLCNGAELRDEPALLLCKDGSQKYVLVSSNGCFEGGEFRYTRCFTRDASERFARDRALEQRNSIVTLAPVGAVLLTAPDLRFELANDAYCKLVGRANVTGRTFVEVFPELEGSRTERMLRDAMCRGTPYATDEYPIVIDIDGVPQERFLKFNLQPLPRARDGLHDLIAVVVDVTELVRARRELEGSVAERERLLESARDASRVKDEFLAMLGHELRNPLSPIVTALRLMQMRGDNATTREQAVIQRQVQHLVRLVDDLLDVSRIARGHIELKRQKADLSTVLANAVEQASFLVEQRNHRLELDVHPGLRCDCDPTRISQVVANLLTNAARYTPPGGEIVLRAQRDGTGMIAISVRDNGSGIAPGMLPRIFELFFQGPRGVDRSEGGLGIGLALVKSLVELHGGSVEARSGGLGQGSEFTVQLREDEVGAQLPQRADNMRPAGAADAKRILLVDDNVDAAETMAELLRVAGHTVFVHHDPASALASLADVRPQVALLDIGLPVMDGYELASHVRQSCGGECRLVALTGYGQDNDKERSSQAGFDLHFVKPVAPAELLRALAGS